VREAEIAAYIDMTAVPQSQVSISRRPLDIEDYIDIARRHVSWIIGPLYAGIVISTMIAFFLPNTYLSRAVLRITPSQIPDTLVPATFNQLMNDRVTEMWQEITSRTSLSELIQRPTLDLYKSQRASRPLDDVIEAMRSKDIKLENLGFQTSVGKPASAFAVTFQYEDRFKAQQVVNALVSKFTDANHQVQKSGVDSTLELIQDEVGQAKADVDRLDGEITAFKMANAGRLPEQLSINVNAMTSLQTSLNSVNEALSRNQGDKMMQETNLSNLQAQYTQFESSLGGGAEESSQAVAAKNEELVQLNHEITLSEAKLTAMRQTYTDHHPDVIDFKANLDALKKRRDQLAKDDATARAEAASKPKAARKPVSNMAAQQQLAQLKQRVDNVKDALKILDMEKAERLKQQEKYQRELQTYQDRIQASPANEQKYTAMLRDRQIAAARYEDLERKQQLATQGQQVQIRKAGENLEVLDPASLPETPTAPNRWQIVGLGAAAGLMLGFSLAATREMRDTSLKNLKDVRAYTNLPVLSSIPLLENALLLRRKRSLVYAGWAVAVIVGCIGTAGSLYYHFTAGQR
jgi:uncharacterized protein involved in exopolysaccharide biosynthesis